MLTKKELVDSLIRIILDNECKINIDFLFCNETYFFIYDVKTTKLGQFSDLKIFHVNNFQVCISVVVDMQLQS